MPDEELKYRLRTEDETEKGLKESERSLKAFSRKAGDIAKGIGKAFVGAFAAASAGIATFVGLSIPKFLKQQRAIGDVSRALKQVGVDASSRVPELEKFASAIQDITGIGDEDLLGLQSEALRKGLDPAAIEEFTIAAVGLASQIGVELPTAFDLLTKSANGQTETLSRYGIVVDQSLDTQGKFNEVLKQGQEGFALAAEDSEDLGKRLEALKGRWGDLQEAVVEAVSGITGDGSDGITLIENLILDATDAVGIWAEAWGEWADFAMKAIGSVGGVLQSFGDRIAGFSAILGALSAGSSFSEALEIARGQVGERISAREQRGSRIAEARENARRRREQRLADSNQVVADALAQGDVVSVNAIAAKNKDKVAKEDNKAKQKERLRKVVEDISIPSLVREEIAASPTESAIDIGDISLFNRGATSIRNISRSLGSSNLGQTVEELAAKENKKNIAKTAEGIQELNKKIGAASIT